jgi:glyoxylase-like metal-dependent hydrolase (beta-lactamase superfamily II)
MVFSYPFSVGRLKCYALEAGLLRLDGGAMFGIVPKPLWQRRVAPDDRNRIALAMRPLLIEHPDGLVLIDTGLGNKEDPKFREIYGVENAGQSGPTQLEDALLEVGYQPGEVRWVINTHLHFDHAGGNTKVENGSSGSVAFPNATFVVQRDELEFARHTNERTRGSYLEHNFDLIPADRWRLLHGEEEILPGIRARLTPGHVPFHQSILLRDQNETAIFLGDVMPTAWHLPLPWIMGYDLEPLRTLESKRALLREATEGGWLLVFEHDPGVILGRADAGSSETALTEVVHRTR